MGVGDGVVGRARARERQPAPKGAAILQSPARQPVSDRRDEVGRQHVGQRAARQGRLDRVDDLADVSRVSQHQQGRDIGCQHHGVGLDRARDMDRLALAEAGIHRLGADPLPDGRHHGLARQTGPEALQRVDRQPCHRAAVRDLPAAHTHARAQRLRHAAEHVIEALVQGAAAGTRQEPPPETRDVRARHHVAEIIAPDHGFARQTGDPAGALAEHHDGPGRIQADDALIQTVEFIGRERIEIDAAFGALARRHQG